MPLPKYTPAGAATTDLILLVFRLNGLLLAEGDRLTRDLGISSARWQVMGTLANGALTVSQAARNMGLQRQSVQRLVNEMCTQDIVCFDDNPQHKRAKLVRLTAKGARLYEQISKLQIPWANALTQGIEERQVQTAIALLSELESRLQSQVEK